VKAAGSAIGGARGSAVSFVVLTGLSGAGKSQAIRALEDLGYFCVDNLPTALIPTLAEFARQAGRELARVAIVVDVREPAFVSKFPAALRRLRASRGITPVLVFLEATSTALLRRFSETRRPHPLARNRSVAAGIREERLRLAPIRRLADEIVDTTDLTVHELRERFMTAARGRDQERSLLVTFLSFGFRHGLPGESDLVFDVRCLPNPHFVPQLRTRTGRDQRVVQYMLKHRVTRDLLARLAGLTRFLVPHYVHEGKSYLTAAIGCTGGRHRSVMIAEALKKELAGLPRGVRLRVRHRDVNR